MAREEALYLCLGSSLGFGGLGLARTCHALLTTLLPWALVPELIFVEPSSGQCRLTPAALVKVSISRACSPCCRRAGSRRCSVSLGTFGRRDAHFALDRNGGVNASLGSLVLRELGGWETLSTTHAAGKVSCPSRGHCELVRLYLIEDLRSLGPWQSHSGTRCSQGTALCHCACIRIRF